MIGGVLHIFLTLSWVGLLCMIVTSGHTYLLFQNVEYMYSVSRRAIF